jgi:hypothetical protein
MAAGCVYDDRPRPGATGGDGIARRRDGHHWQTGGDNGQRSTGDDPTAHRRLPGI